MIWKKHAGVKQQRVGNHWMDLEEPRHAKVRPRLSEVDASPTLFEATAPRQREQGDIATPCANTTCTPHTQWSPPHSRHELMEGTINGRPKPFHNGDTSRERERDRDKEKERSKEDPIMSPESSSSNSAKPRLHGQYHHQLQLPLSVNPPGPSNPPKQLVWIVRPSPLPSTPSTTFIPTTNPPSPTTRSSARQATWAAP